MNAFADALEATALAQFLKGSYWVYPLVNAGHIFGIALLIGAVVPMDLRLVGVLRRPDLAATTALLRPFAVTGLILAAGFGALLFITQAGDYLGNRLFLAKMGLLALAVLNAAAHWHLGRRGAAPRAMAVLSLMLWPAILLLGRFVGYSFG